MEATSKELYYMLNLLKHELSVFKSEHKKLKIRISSFVENNRLLIKELKENARIRLNDLPTDSNITALERKLQAALASKNAALEMWQATLQELEKQNQLLLGEKSIIETERKEVDSQIDFVKSDYMKGLNVLSGELSDTRSELSKVKRELESKIIELEEHKKLSIHNSNKLQAECKQVELYLNERKEMNDKIVSLELLLSDIKNTLSTNKNEMLLIHSEKRKLEQSNDELKEQNSKLKLQIKVFEKNAKDSLHTAQEAILQKKEITFREKQALKQIQELKSAMNLEVDKVNLRFKAEIRNIQKQSAAKIQSLVEEIQVLHQEHGEKQSLFEKAEREKQALDNKLELLTIEGHSRFPVSDDVFNDLCKRLTLAEKSRDEFELQSRSLQMTLNDMIISKEQEFQFISVEKNNIKVRLQTLMNDLSKASSDQIKLTDDVIRLKKNNCELEKELKSSKEKFKCELAILEKQLQSKQHEYDQQLQLNEEYHQKMFAELQQLLTAEFKISSKWKDAVQELALKSEIKINELCENVHFLRSHNDELSNVLQKK